MKRFANIALHMTGILAASVITGYLLLVLVFCIPQSRLFNGLGNSVPVLQRDNLEEVVFGYPSSRLDVFTDGAMLNAALHTCDESPFKRAVACYQYIYYDLSRSEGFIAYFEPREPDGSMSYVRYWHGMLVYLKPLLLFFNYSDIRMLNQLGQVALMCLLIYAFAARKMYRYIPAVFMVYFFLMPYTLPFSMQYSNVFYIGFGALAVLFLFYDRIKDGNGLLYLFLLTGIITSYMDLLTYPVFAVGLPLAGLIILDAEYGNAGTGFVYEVKRFVSCAISWAVGYAGMWAGKILIALPFYGTQAFADALESAGKRSGTGAASEGITYADALYANLFMYKNSIYKLSLILYTLAVIAFIVYYIVKRKGSLRTGFIPFFLCITASPFMWYFVTVEHAHVHAFMTYKSLTVAVFAYCLMLVYMLRIDDGSQRKEDVHE